MKALSLFILSVVLFHGTYSRELQWDWSKIDTNIVSFPMHFAWGCSDSALQTEGMESSKNAMVPNTWTELENQRNIPIEDRVGNACQRWTRYAEDIDLMKQLGMTLYRFSVEWSKIEPEEGVFDEHAMQHYVDQVDAMLHAGITPMITLMHHTLPMWFAAKGGFEIAENAIFFQQYAEYVFRKLHHKIPLWILFNEPIAYAIEAYWRGNYYPAQRSFRMAGRVALNVLNAHVKVYRHLKTIDEQPKIGIAHIIQPLDTFHDWNPLEKVVCKMFDHVVSNLLLKFFINGKFNWLMFVRDRNEMAPGALDFIGINYYTHSTLKQSSVFHIGPEARPDEKQLTPVEDDQRGCKVMYPEGLYRAIRRASMLKIPMYITENGSSTDDPELTDEYLKKHIYVLSRALEDGYDVRGYLMWTLMDCFGWKKAYRAKHGIYAVDFKTQERTYRPAFDYLISVIKQHQPSIQH